MKFSKAIVFIFILPITLFLDFLLFASGIKCPSCGNFWVWLSSNASLSFPLISLITETVNMYSNKITEGNKTT